VRGLPRTWIERVNSLPCSRLSVDIPSGLDGDEGHVLGASVRAHMTVTFGLPKRGLLTGEGPSVTGFLVVADISIPREELESARDA
jgi:NAD(P)H-hydrate epimerase